MSDQIKHIEYSELSLMDKMLIDKALEMTNHSYAPYSNFYVGAALVLENGVILGGCNQENASYPLCMCGERVALYNAAANYPKVAIDTLAIIARNPEKMVDKPISPCGACRQVIAEFQRRQDKPIRIILKGETGKALIINHIKELLPHMFDETFL